MRLAARKEKSGKPEAASSRRFARRRVRDNVSGYLFLAPYLLVFGVFMLYPVAQGLWVSLHEWSVLGQERPFVGTANYRAMIADPVFWKSLWNTIYFALLSTPLLVAAGLLFALLLNQQVRGKSFFRAAIFAPYLLSISVVALLWLWILQPRYGLLDFYLGRLGIVAPNWLANPDYAMPAIVLTTLWWTVGFNMVIYLAGLQEIPEDVIDAAAIDGANRFQRFRLIVVPLLRRVTLFVTVMQLIKSLQVFGQVYIITGGGPFGATRVLVQYIYENGFRYWRMGYAAAMGYALLALILVFTIIQFRLARREE
jgi:multiple sugar transport system permease protein